MKTTNQNPFLNRASFLNPIGLRTNLNAIGRIGSEDTIQEIIEKIESRTGQFSTITIISLADGSMRKVDNPYFGQGILKVSKFQVRFGISYENKASTIEKRENGNLPQPPKGKNWLDFPYWLASSKTNEVLVACSPVQGSKREDLFFDKDFNELDQKKLEPHLKKKPEYIPEWNTISLKKIVKIV